MSRSIGSANETATTAPAVQLALFAEFDFPSGWVRVWSGIGDFTTLSRTFSGIGTFGRMSQIEETADVSARGVEFELSCAAGTVALALGEYYRGRPCRSWLGFMNSTRTALLDTPYQIFAGRMDTMHILDGSPASIVRLSAENRLADMGRARTSRWTHEEQTRRFAGDLGFEYIARIAESPIYWGVAAPASAASGAAPGGGVQNGDPSRGNPWRRRG